MNRVEIIESRAYEVHGTVLIEPNDSVWYTFCRPWWDIASWLWWWLMPGQKKWVVVRRETGKRVRVPAVRIAKTHVRIGTPKEGSQ